MDRRWYMRMTVVVAAITAAWFSLWPTLSDAGVIGAPSWVTETFEGRINPGLDIRGGLRLMYEVEVDEYIVDRRNRDAERMVRQIGVLIGVLTDDEITTATREQLDSINERVTVQRVGERGIRVLFEREDDRELFDVDWLQENFPELRLASNEGNQLDLRMREDRLEELREDAVKQAVRTIDDRVNALGLGQADVSARESDVIVEIPGANERQFESVKAVIARTARLEFKVVDDATNIVGGFEDLPEGMERIQEAGYAGEGRRANTSFLYFAGPTCSAEQQEADECETPRQTLEAYIQQQEIPDDHQLLVSQVRDEDRERYEDEPNLEETEAWRTFYVVRTTEVTGEDIDDARVGFDPQEGTVVYLTFNVQGAGEWATLTGQHVQERIAVVLDDRVESAPVIQEEISGGSTRITLGSDVGDPQRTVREANDLVVVLKAGALPAPLTEANSQLIGPTLGQDSVRMGAMGAVVGVSLVLLFMIFYYQVAGIVSAIAVVLNLLFMLAIMSGFSPPLTLPGIASLALTVGMAVDANVLITERIREELRAGKSARAAVDQGFKRAFSSVFDSQLTTFIAGVVLLQYGSGPIKGFAVMLLIGIVTSLFTGIFCSKVFFDWIVRGLKVKRLRVG